MRFLALILSLFIVLSGCSNDTDRPSVDIPDASGIETGLETEDITPDQEPTEAESPSGAQEESVQNESDSGGANEKTSLTYNFTKATMTNVVDGDTIDIQYSDGSTQRVRLIGVNTPETKHPTKGVEYYGYEASVYTNNSLNNRTVYLQKDVSETDRYGRSLRYVWLEVPSNENSKSEVRSKMFNAALITNGYANLMTYPPDVKYADYFESFESEARSGNVGLWSSQLSESSSSDNRFDDKSETDESFSYMESSNSMKLHKVDCPYAVKTSESNRVYFNSRDKAINAGYVPCKVCNP